MNTKTKVNISVKPFYLEEAQINWVQQTLDSMSTREKVGQLFCLNIVEEDVSSLIAKTHGLNIEPGAYMTRAFSAKTVQDNFRALQKNAKYPLLFAANLERGADGVCEEGTLFGTQMQVAATNDKKIAYDFGYVCAQEGVAVGANWNFGPIVDIDYNFHNPITNTRVFSSDPDMVLSMSKACVSGMHDAGIATCIKHWPGDGRDERDQHMVTSINDCSVQEWDETYGKIYKDLIEQGAHSVMSAHIMLPEYSRKLVPGIKDEEILPGSLSYELNTILLREKLGFNGLIVSDATTMNGFMQAMDREKAVPTCIASGVDMFLFVLDLEEDFNFMLAGVEKGIISQERLDEAVTRILGMKASLGLCHATDYEENIPGEEELQVFKRDMNRQKAKECADKSITLVKDTQKLLPISLADHKKVLMHVLGDVGGYHDNTRNHWKYFKKLLEKEGFEVTLFEKENPEFNYIDKPVLELQKRYDLILYFSNIKTSGSDTVARIQWEGPGAVNSTRYIHDIPTIFISVDNPYHLFDVPNIKTMINGYTANEYVLESIINKIMGRSSFIGKSPVDPFCGLWNAKL